MFFQQQLGVIRIFDQSSVEHAYGIRTLSPVIASNDGS